MPYLKYYSKEREIYPDENNLILEEKDIKEFIDDACYKFYLKPIFVHFNKLKSYEGMYNERWSRITVDKKSLLVVVHELAHHMDSQDNGKLHKGYNRAKGRRDFRKAHTKKHMDCMIKLFDYYKFWKNPTKYNGACKITIKGEIKDV